MVNLDITQAASKKSLISKESREAFSAGIMNKELNRYCDVLPYDSNRVTLSSLENDYVNASYIDGAFCSKEFIAAQAPTPKTFESFWTMVWENNVRVIIMLTELIEARKVKAHRYWPSTLNNPSRIGQIVITLLSTTSDDTMAISEIAVEKNGKSVTVQHIHYKKWEDRSAPENLSSIKQLLAVFDNFHQLNGPATPKSPYRSIIHCSAGIGRTGTFIALKKITDYLAVKSVRIQAISAIDLVNELRKQRDGMVQTSDQLTFVHNFLETAKEQLSGTTRS